jgi:CRISPR/Cas system-associated exonuclease Cas4 (RecB family)
MTALSQLLNESRAVRSVKLMDDWAQSIVDTINSGYTDTDKWRQKKSFAPSSLFYGPGDCARRWVLSMTGCLHESKTTQQNVMRMKKGIADHARIQQAMENAGMVIEVEKELRNSDPPIHAFADAILKVLEELVVAEIKTTSLKNFEYRQQTNKIASYHLGQLLIYMFLLGIDKGVIIYEATKPDGEVLLHAIPVEMTDEYREEIEGVLAWCRKVYAVYKEGVLPTRGHRKDSKICKSCPVEKTCDESDAGTRKIQGLKYNL